MRQAYDPNPPICLHCKRQPAKRSKAGLRALGLCRYCYNLRPIRDMYVRGTVPSPRVEEEDDPRPERKPGDKYHRCLWCMKWECDEILKLCASCQKEYEASVEPVQEYVEEIGEQVGFVDF